MKLLWALGAAGQLVQEPEGLGIKANRASLDEALGVLDTVGFDSTYYGADGLPCKWGDKKRTDVAVRHPHHRDPLLRGMAYYAAHLPEKKSGRKETGIILEVLLRADFRPLLPGYTFHVPHLPATEEEVTRSFTLATLKVWRAITHFMASRHPEYRLFFRVPRIRGRGWVAAQALPNLLEHITDLSLPFQEAFLNSVACKDCVRCGKHVVYTHGDHVHRWCKTPWYFSPHLSLEDLPDIERLVDLRLADVLG